jgi:hypothetical protein
MAHRKTWTFKEAQAEFDKNSDELAALGRRITAWTDTIPGSGYKEATKQPEIKPAVYVGTRPVPLLALSIEGKVHLAFQAWTKNVPVLRDEAVRKRLLEDINRLLGTHLRGTTSWPSFPISLLRDPRQLERFLGILGDLVKRFRDANG